MDLHNIEMLAKLPGHCSELYVTVLDWWLKLEFSRPLYVPTPSVFSYSIGLYMSGGNDCERLIAIGKNASLLMFFA